MIKSESIIPLLTVCAKSENTGCARVGELSIEIINRQKAEIESLKQIIDEQDKEIIKLQKRIIFWRKDLNYQPEKIKSEAIKEFAERLKTRFNDLSLHTKNHGKSISVDEIDKTANWILHEVVPKEIDKIVKDMTRSDDE